MNNIPIEQVMSLTGLTKRQVFRLTREGRIPAAIVSGRYVMTPAQLDTLNREGIAPPKPEPEPTPIDNPLAPERFFKTRRAS